MIGRRLTRLLPLAAVLLAAPLFVAACSDGGTASSASPSSSPVVTVDGTPASAADLLRVRKVAALTGVDLSRRQALRRLVAELLVKGEARRLGLRVSAEEVLTRLSSLERAAGGEKQLRAQLRQAGVSQAQLREEVRAVLLGEKLQEAKFPGVTATKADARRYYRGHQSLFTAAAAVDLGQIVMRTERIAASVRDRIEAGQSFSSAAAQFNLDYELRSARGRLGWVSTGSLPPAIRSAVARLDPGQVSPVVHSAPYWHLLKLYHRRPARVTPFARVATAIRGELTRQKRDAALTRWIEKARAAARITTG